MHWFDFLHLIKQSILSWTPNQKTMMLNMVNSINKVHWQQTYVWYQSEVSILQSYTQWKCHLIWSMLTSTNCAQPQHGGGNASKNCWIIDLLRLNAEVATVLECRSQLRQDSVFFGSGYRTAYGSSYLKPYSTATCNVTITHGESVIGFIKMY